MNLNDSPQRTQTTQKILRLKEFKKNQLCIYFVKASAIRVLIKRNQLSLCAQCSLWFMK
jgi:hypothetical protein